MGMPKEASGCRAPSAAISWRTILVCSGSRPPPPYSFGQCGTVQPLSRIRSNQRRCGSDENLVLRPPRTYLHLTSSAAAFPADNWLPARRGPHGENFPDRTWAFPFGGPPLIRLQSARVIGRPLAVISRNSIYL